MAYKDLKNNFSYKNLITKDWMNDLAANASWIAEELTSLLTSKPEGASVDVHHYHTANGLEDNINVSAKGFNAAKLDRKVKLQYNYRVGIFETPSEGEVTFYWGEGVFSEIPVIILQHWDYIFQFYTYSGHIMRNVSKTGFSMYSDHKHWMIYIAIGPK